MITKESQCKGNNTKPDCSECPDAFNIPDCDKIINCQTADPVVYHKAAFQVNTAQPRNPDPCVIVMAQSPECIQAVVKKVTLIRTTTQFKTLKIAIRGGRHSYIGASTVSKGVVIDISRIKYIVQHYDKGLMTVGAGITLGELYYQLWNTAPNRLLFPGGTCPTVGLSGLTLGGGQGVVGRKHGLATDQIVGARMVNSQGDIMIINETNNRNLSWALQGGGNGNFGVVYEFTLKHYPIPHLVSTDYLIYFHHSKDWFEMFKIWQDFILDRSFEDNHNVWSQLTVTPKFLSIGFHVSGAEGNSDVIKRIEALAEVPGTTPEGYHPHSPYIKCSYVPANYSGSIAFWGGCTKDNRCGTTEDLLGCLQWPTNCGGQPFRMNSAYQSGRLPDEGIRTVIGFIQNVKIQTGCQKASIEMDTMGGKINEVHPTATAFPHRTNTLTYQFLSYFTPPCDKIRMKQWLDEFHKSMSKYTTPGAYRNYANLNLSEYNERYFRHNLPRLIQIKLQHDPENIFSYSQSIKPFAKILPPVKSPLVFWHDRGNSTFAFISILVTIIIVVYVLRRLCIRHPHQE